MKGEITFTIRGGKEESYVEVEICQKEFRDTFHWFFNDESCKLIRFLDKIFLFYWKNNTKDDWTIAVDEITSKHVFDVTNSDYENPVSFKLEVT